jgi:hypothetical protein
LQVRHGNSDVLNFIHTEGERESELLSLFSVYICTYSNDTQT